jgi:hypothetical protein
MKRLYAVIAAVLALSFFSPQAYAVSCLGTKMPRAHKWFWGAETNLLFKRALDKDYGKMNSRDYFIIASYALTDWLCLDGKIGIGDIRARSSAYDLDYNTNFAGGYGFRIKLFDREDNPYKIVCGFQHISVHPDAAYAGIEKKEPILDDWQGSLVVSYNGWKTLTPYLGAKFSECDLIEWTDGERKRKKSRNGASWGLAAGLYYFVDPSVWVVVEGRFFDERALSCALVKSF